MVWYRQGVIALIAILTIKKIDNVNSFSVNRAPNVQPSSWSLSGHKSLVSDFNNDRRSFLVKSSVAFVSIIGLVNDAPLPAMAVATAPANVTTTAGAPTPSSSTIATTKPSVPANATSSVSSSPVVTTSNQTTAATKTTTTSVPATTTSSSTPVTKITSPSVSKVIPANPGDVKNCPDFATYDEAKKWFDTYYPYYGDVAKLDGNNDGIPCEKLPGAPSKK